MGNHTKIPWQASNGEIRTKQNVLLATMKAHLPINGIDQKANAAFIVKAVNNHDALVEALLSCYNELKSKTRVGESELVLRKCEAALAQVEKG